MAGKSGHITAFFAHYGHLTRTRLIVFAGIVTINARHLWRNVLLLTLPFPCSFPFPSIGRKNEPHNNEEEHANADRRRYSYEVVHAFMVMAQARFCDMRRTTPSLPTPIDNCCSSVRGMTGAQQPHKCGPGSPSRAAHGRAMVVTVTGGRWEHGNHAGAPG